MRWPGLAQRGNLKRGPATYVGNRRSSGRTGIGQRDHPRARLSCRLPEADDRGASVAQRFCMSLRFRIVGMDYQTLCCSRFGTGWRNRHNSNRPDKLNALNDQVMAELGDAAERIATARFRGKADPHRARAPKSFVAGADIGDLSRPGPFDGKARAMRGQACCGASETCGKAGDRGRQRLRARRRV